MFRWSVLLVTLVLISIAESEVCYPKVGCFSMEPPWRLEPARPIMTPQDPSMLNVTLELFTTNQPKAGSKVEIYPNIQNNKRFKAGRKKTIFIIPDVGGLRGWGEKMKDVLLDRVEANVYLVNCSQAFDTINFFRAAGNARVVAAEVALFIESLKENFLSSEKVWIIGFGLGAHIAGYIGKRQKVGRITGLDPSQLLFEGFDPRVRLDRGDATFVDVIHTDARPQVPEIGFGYMDPIGDVDFYVNGGHGQPGCLTPNPLDFKTTGALPDIVREIVRQIVKRLICHHTRAVEIFVDALQNPECVYWGHEATKQNILRGLSNAAFASIFTKFIAITDPCTLDNCVPMGMDSAKAKKRGNFVITTYSEKPYCVDSSNSVENRISNFQVKSIERWIFTLNAHVSLPIQAPGANDDISLL